MAKVLVVTSGKGGVGKTTSTAALGAALAKASWWSISTSACATSIS
jgi:septum formation inhibitor-activating ATPase MinD